MRQNFFISNNTFIVIFLFFIRTFNLSGYTTLAYSSAASNTTSNLPVTPPTEIAAYNYPSRINGIDQALWIWAGYGNQLNCPMDITVTDQINITCLNQPIVLYAAADHNFTANFLGQILSGDNWKIPSSISIDVSDKTCNTKYILNLDASNDYNQYEVKCGPMNVAAVIYAVVQKTVCCQNNSYFFNSSTCKCESCSSIFVGCLTCSLTSCFSCDTSGHFFISGSTCFCITNTYLLNNSICTPCGDFITDCMLCANSTYCIQCIDGTKLNLMHECEPCDVGCLNCNLYQCISCNSSNGFLLDNGICICPQNYGIQINQCQQCSVMIPNCTTCKNNTVCISCLIGSMINQNNICEQCGYKCLNCELSKGCSVCELGYYPNNQNCVSHCGDGILAMNSTELCDDGNLDNYDGCNSQCQVQQNFTCSEINSFSQCSYFGSFKLYVKYITKQVLSNQIMINLGIKPNIPILKKLNFSNSILIQNSFKFDSFQDDPKGDIMLYFNLTQTIQGHINNLVFDPASSSQLFSATPKYSIPIQMTTNSNIPLTYYSKYQYDMSKIIITIVELCIYTSYFLLIIGLIVHGKVVGIQLFFVWQVMYLSIGNLNKVNPIYSGIFKLNFVNGYNMMLKNDDRYVPERLNALKFQSQIQKNLNFQIVIQYFISYFLPMITYICSIFLSKYKTTLTSITKQILKEYSFALTIFGTINFAFCTGIQILYGKNNVLGSFDLGANLILLVLTFLAFTYLNKYHYGQFIFLLKNKIHTRLYFNFSLIYRFFSGLLLSLLNQSHQGIFYMLLLSIIFLVYQISSKPFKKGYHNYRTIVCQISVVAIIWMRVYFRSFKNNYSISEMSKQFLPAYIEVILLCLCTIMSFIIVIYEICTKIKKKQKILIEQQNILSSKYVERVQTQQQQSHQNIELQ